MKFKPSWAKLRAPHMAILPFWYDTLQDLLKLRSTLADKQEGQRNERQATTAPAKP